ncbi:MAG: choice-of-anchor I family protein, partial [Planctomycetota bacterium]
QLTPIGGYGAGVFDESAAEIAAFDAGSAQLFVVNGATDSIDVLDISDPTLPTLVTSIGLPVGSAFGGVNSVAVSDGVIAVAAANSTPTDPGLVALYNLADFSLANTVTVGALPDSLAFTADGTKIVVANEGEASEDGTVNPDGTISVIDLTAGVGSAAVSDLTFAAFAGSLDEANSPVDSVRINPVAQTNFGVLSDLEPEFVSINGDTAYVSVQENNAIAVVDLTTDTITDLLPLGVKDHSVPGNGLDARDNDDLAIIETQPVNGMYMPDGIATYTVNGETFIVTANEGDGREDGDFAGFQDFDDLDQLTVDPNFNGFMPTELAEFLDNDTGIGDLEISSIDGDTDNDGDLDQLFSFGARSFSIFDSSGNLVFDSGDDFETITAAFPDVVFNATNDENDSLENRSDDAGPEPEGVVLGEVDGRTYAFIGLERVGGIMVYDVTDPNAVALVEYVNPRDFSMSDDDLEDFVNDADGTLTGDLGALDLGPEGLVFISAADSPNGLPLLVVTNEVSGTTTIYRVIPEPATLGLLTLSALTLTRRRQTK